MTYIAPPSELAPETRGQLEAFADAHGHFVALRAVVARFPAALKALDNQYRLIMGRGRLDRWVRDAVFSVSSAERGNTYLADAMAREAVRHGANAEWIKSIVKRQDAAVPEPRQGLRSLITFSRKAAVAPYKSVPGDVSSLRAAGWTNEDLVEVLSVISLSVYMDILSLSLRIGQ
jgi:alkylhydroperoxidase/carboxymuconolactone decarboxylase family protein YurZ